MCVTCWLDTLEIGTTMSSLTESTMEAEAHLIKIPEASQMVQIHYLF